jgi:pimeloyl-ACP methyl ester carboxylesterase
MRKTFIALIALTLSWGCSEDPTPTPDPTADMGGGADVTATDTADDVGEEADTTPDAAADVPPDAQPTWHEDCPIDVREERRIDVGEVTLNVACRGAGPTVVFLHGFPEFHYSWNKVMDELVEDFRLIAPDQRGYNTSDKPEAVQAYALPHLTQDIVNLLPLVSPDPVILVAHDWGGPVGWLVAHTPDAHIRGFVATNGPHPQRFVELIAHDEAQREASSYMTFFRSPAAEAFFTPDALAEQFDFLTPEELEEYERAWSQPGAITGGLNWYRANLLTIESVEEIMAPLSPTVSVPTVVMWGLDDDAVLASNAEGLEQYVIDLEVETFEGVDHWIEHRIPGEIARVIREVDERAQ